MKIKIIMRCHFTHIRIVIIKNHITSVGGDEKTVESPYIVGENISHGNQPGSSSKVRGTVWCKYDIASILVKWDFFCPSLWHHSTLLSSWCPVTPLPPPPPSHCDNLKNLQTLPNVPRDSKSFLAEKQLKQMMYFPVAELCPLSFCFCFWSVLSIRQVITDTHRKEEAALTASLLVQTRQPLQLPLLFLSICSHRAVASQTFSMAQVIPSLLMDNTTWPSLLEMEPGGCLLSHLSYSIRGIPQQRPEALTFKYLPWNFWVHPAAMNILVCNSLYSFFI